MRYTLKENALHSLEHGVEHLEGTLLKNRRVHKDTKFALLHIFHACELLLKLKVEELDPALLFKKKRPRRTISCETAKNILKARGALTTEQARAIQSIESHRDAITHHELVTDEGVARQQVGEALTFILKFSEDSLGLVLRDELSPHIYSQVRELIRSYEEQLAEARASLDEKWPYRHDKDADFEGSETEVCFECGQDFVDVDGECHYCGATIERGVCICGAPCVTGEAWCSYHLHVTTKDD